MRINKYLSQAGVCSRREADQLVELGKVLVNQNKAELGHQLEIGDEIEVNSINLVYTGDAPEKIYLAFNKPKGIVCTCSKKDPNNIIDFIKFPERVYPIGRLDQDSKGLILLTNDGELAYKLSHPKFEHEKEYLVSCAQKITDKFIDAMKRGINLDEKKTSPCHAEQVGSHKFKIILKEGLNRQIRRMCKKLEYDVKELIRIRIDKLELDRQLESGSYVRIDKDKISKLFAI